MLYDVVFVFGDDVIIHASAVDLDYWSIRDWRAMWRHLLKVKFDSGFSYEIRIKPTNPESF